MKYFNIFSSESITYHHVIAFLLHSRLLTHFYMIGNIVILPDESFQNDVSPNKDLSAN
jgi:hypothetical protein